MAMGTRTPEQPPPRRAGASVLHALERVAGCRRFRRVGGSRLSILLRAGVGPPESGARSLLPLVVGGVLRRPRFGARLAWRAADSLAVRSFVRLGLEDAAPDHSTISRTRRLIDVETHRAVFTWVQARLVAAGLNGMVAAEVLQRIGGGRRTRYAKPNSANTDPVIARQLLIVQYVEEAGRITRNQCTETTGTSIRTAGRDLGRDARQTRTPGPGRAERQRGRLCLGIAATGPTGFRRLTIFL